MPKRKADEEKIKSFTLVDLSTNLFNEKKFSFNSKEGIKCSFAATRLFGGPSDQVDIIEVKNGRLTFTVVPTRGMGIWKGELNPKAVPVEPKSPKRKTKKAKQEEESPMKEEKNEDNKQEEPQKEESKKEETETPVFSLGWNSPVKDLVHPKFINLNDRGGLGWLYGFNEWIVRCGLDSNGAPGEDKIVNNNGNETKVHLNLHGRIANIPAHFVQVEIEDNSIIRIIGHVREASLFTPKLELRTVITTEANSNSFEIHDEIVNLAPSVGPQEFQMLYHINLGQPLLQEGSKLTLPMKKVCPRNITKKLPNQPSETYDTYISPFPGYVEQVNLYEPLGRPDGSTLATLVNKDHSKAIAVHFNLKELPCFTQWKSTGSEEEGYVTGLEPATNYPNTKRFEREYKRVGHVDKTPYSIKVKVEVVDEKEGVQALLKEVETIQASQKPVIETKPLPSLSELAS